MAYQTVQAIMALANVTLQLNRFINFTRVLKPVNFQGMASQNMRQYCDDQSAIFCSHQANIPGSGLQAAGSAFPQT